MASKLGSIFVEIELSDKVYRQKMSEIGPDAVATTRGVETAWKGLGVKTNQYFDDSRKAAENAYKLIENSGKHSADELLRAEKAKNDKINQLNEQQHGKQISLLSSLKAHYLAVTAAVVVAVSAISKAWDLAKAGADYKEQEGILNNLARKYGTTAEGIVNSMEQASDGLVSKANLMKIALGGLAKGLDPAQLTDLADAARLLGDTVGMTATESLTQLTMALETGRTKGLKMFMGSAIDLETVMGDLYSKMTEAEKTQALYNITMMEAKKLQSEMTGEVNDAGDKIERLEAKWANLKTTVSVFTMEVMVGLFDAFGYMKGVLTEQDEMVDEFGRTVDKASLSTETLASKIWNWVVPAFKAWAETEEEAENRLLATVTQTDAVNKSLKSHTENINEDANATKALIAPYQATIDKLKAQVAAREGNKTAMVEEAKAAAAALKSMVADTEKANAEMEGMNKTQYEKDIARIEAEAAKYLAASNDAVAVNKWKTAQIELAEKKQADIELTNRIKVAEATYKAEEAMMKAIQEGVDASLATIKKGEEEKQALREKSLADYKAMMTDEADFAATENERAINKIIAQENDKLNKLYQIYADGGISYKEMQEAEVKINANAKGAILTKETENATKIASLNASLLAGVRGQEEKAYQARLKEIDALAAKQIAEGADYSAVMARKQADAEKAYADMGYKADGFFGGVKAGLIVIKGAHKDWADAAKALTIDFANASKTAVSDILFQAIKDGTVNMTTVWETFCGSMLRKLTDTIADMVTTAIAKDILMFFKADWTKDSSNVLAIINGAISLWNSIDWGSGNYEGGFIAGQARTNGDSYLNDTVIARVSPGEYIVPRSAVTAQTLPVLEYMRSNKTLPAYAGGGVVDDPRRNRPMLGWNTKYPILSANGADPLTSALYIAQRPEYYRSMKFKYDDVGSDSKQQELIMSWAESYLSTSGEWGDPRHEEWKDLWWRGFGDADMLGLLRLPASGERRFFQDETYTDHYAQASNWGWLVNFMAQATKWVSTAIISYCTAYVGAGLLGPYIGASAGAGVGAAASTYILTGGNWQAAIIAGITAAAMSAISSYFTDAGASSDTSSYLDNGEFQAWQADPSYTDALYSDVGQGSTAAWWNNILNSAGKFTIKALAKNVIKIAAGGLGKDRSNQGHATYDYHSTDDQGVFGGLAGLADMLAPQSNQLSLNFIGGGGVSARNGLSYVPYDNFPAILHQGERVLTKEENRGGGKAPVFHIYLDGDEIKGRMRIVADKVYVDRASSGISSTQRVYA